MTSPFDQIPTSPKPNGPFFSRRLQQLLLVVFAVVLALHYFLTYQPIPDSARHTFEPPELPPTLQALHLGELELALAGLHFDEHNQLLLDAQTASSLDAAATQLPVDADEKMLDRVSFLLGKQFTSDRARQVDALFRQYFHYKQQEVAWRAQQSPPQSPAEELRPFEQLSALQNQTLGIELAEQLFGEYRRVARSMFAGREINNNASLSEQEKQQRLKQLKQTIDSTHEAE